MHSIPQDRFVWGIAVQPDSLKGDVFASALSTTSGGVLSIFDIRRSTTGRLNAVIYYFKRYVESNRLVFCFIVI